MGTNIGFGEDTEAHLVEVFRNVCMVEVEDDGLRFDPQSIVAEAIREEMEYGGVRVRLTATLDGARISLQIDVGFGDVVTPAPEEVDYPTLLDLPAPHLRVYPRESVVAEKFQAMVHLGMANSRMKDFYDVWMLCRLFEFDGATLAQAVERTFERRRTTVPAEAPLSLTVEFHGDPGKVLQWGAFLGRNGLEGMGTTLEAVAGAIEGFLMPICLALRSGERFEATWPMGGPWRR
ncbi:nucleotidyl transferase AbiEii/AbiGii toxin family protein [Geoalkalibacter halelectricus]|uniref:Nucleotidyl transferase AbiEii/AbiGii toxin family protein n=1 Tax=Geoalkalibacter halelectricus TaxID=2847045 RepID=A0ABY5ZR46_9BACT|nr:nucleotidyl transferase AbiEii/AbiGii toxin family protein [Geoalkalibacter halelectricus]MDO3377131.1 nucleotidyl transferase AbiEii/AbiGii toxin family protein [Geoalkalibacter halelectricus]UWZ79701.1 nucleotidyl transferase AbiEii/AbiGii toxin family protein [Geoalkalibacter halelectricus]